MRQLVGIFAMIAFLQGCAMVPSLQTLDNVEISPILQESPVSDRLEAVPPIDGEKLTVAVYGFSDKTGQRKPSDSVANLSSAVTQGAEAWVIKALQEVGNGEWFEVVERVGMDNLIKERQLIRNTREVYEKNAKTGPTPLQPMIFAGLILEGGIVGYDSNTAVGGIGARYLGVGASTEYRIDTVTVVMRLVSVSTGKVMMSIATEKSIASYRSGFDVFRFHEMGTRLMELENGYSVNEPINYAVRAAVEQGVIEMIDDGVRKGLWAYKQEED